VVTLEPGPLRFEERYVVVQVVALRDFVQGCASRVSASREWTVLGRPTMLVPRMLMVADAKVQGGQYKLLEAWIRKLHVRANKDFREAAFRSIAVVEGTNAEGLEQIAGARAWPSDVKPLRTHVMELALMHAVDVTIGMGDRMSNGGNNITLNPSTLQPVNIDYDSCLPGMAVLKPAMERSICHFGKADFSIGGTRNATWPRLEAAWPACSPRLPLQGRVARAKGGRASKGDARRVVQNRRFGRSRCAAAL